MKRLALVVALSAVAAEARAFGIQLVNGNALSWPMNTIGYELDADASSDISGTADLDAIQNAVDSWNNVTCALVVLTQTSTTTLTDTILTTNRTDGKNRLAWIEDSRWRYGEWVLAVTTPVFDGAGNISEADIAFNGFEATWSTNGTQTDVESVTVHELGHFIGLQHVLRGEFSADPPTMAPSVDPNERTRTLTADDRAGACYLYPAEPYRCDETCDCPAIVDEDAGAEFNAGRVECASGICGRVIPASGGSGALGAQCSGGDCSGSLFCQPAGNGAAYCSQLCNPSTNNCPSGFDCWPYQGSPDGACMPRNMPPPSGETCLADGGGPAVPGGGTTPGGGTLPGGGTTLDSEAACDCDVTWDCDADCECDPDPCQGCASSAAVPASSPLAAILVAAALRGARRRSRR